MGQNLTETVKVQAVPTGIKWISIEFNKVLFVRIIITVILGAGSVFAQARTTAPAASIPVNQSSSSDVVVLTRQISELQAQVKALKEDLDGLKVQIDG